MELKFKDLKISYLSGLLNKKQLQKSQVLENAMMNQNGRLMKQVFLAWPLTKKIFAGDQFLQMTQKKHQMKQKKKKLMKKLKIFRTKLLKEPLAKELKVTITKKFLKGFYQNLTKMF